MTQPAEAELVRYFTEVTRRADRCDFCFCCFHVPPRTFFSVGVKLPIPEIALIGKQNCGKSSLLDGFVGRLFNYVANNTATRRPLRLALIHDPKCINPRWEVEGAQVTETEMQERVSQVNRALGPANPNDPADCGRINSIPFNVSLTSAHVQNMIILDTPGLRTKGESLTDDIDACVSDIAKNPDVTIFAVLEASENLDAAHVLKIIEKHDPRWERTVLICNKFDKALIDCKSATDVTAWLKGKEGRRWFGTTLPISHDREHLKQHGPAEFDAWCKRSEADQKDILERLGPSLLPHVGISAARNYLHSLIIQKLRDAVPKISAEAAKYLASLHPEIAAAKAAALSCSPDALLKGALTVGSDLTMYIRDLVRGINTKEKVPTKYHFTLEDELQALANAGLNGRIPYADGLADIVSNRTFETCGGAQFDRLLTEVELFFRSVQFPKITASELDNLRAIGESSVRAPWSMVITKSLRGKLANDEDIYSERASGKVDEFSDASIFKSPFAAFVTRCKLICHNMFEVAGLGEGIRSFLAENPRVHDYFRHRYRVLIDLMCANLERQFVGYVRTCAESMRYMSRPEESDSRSSIVDRTSEAMVERVREEMLHQHKSAPWENLGSESQLASPDLLSRFQVNLEMHYKVIRDHLAVYFRHMFAVYVRNYLVQRQLRVELVAQIRDMNTDQFAAQFLPDMENHRRKSAARIAALERKQAELDAIIRLSQQLNANSN